MSALVRAPAVSANEDSILLTAWLRAEGEKVSAGETVCEAETTKATVEVEAPVDGYLRPLVAAGEAVTVGTPIAAVTDTVDEDLAPLLAPPAEKKAREVIGSISQVETEVPMPEATGRRWTLKAAILAKRYGLDIETLADGRTDLVREADVETARGEKCGSDLPEDIYRKPVAPVRDLFEDSHPAGRPERILLLGGGAGAGAMTVDVLARIPSQRAVAILDSNPEAHGRTVGGVPILGGLDRVVELQRAGLFDSAIILFTQDVAERARTFLELRARGVRFANVIDPSAEVRGGTSFGQGNLVMANAFFSTAVTIGDNNFFASHAVVEHHSRIGSHCTFGPRTTTSGAVRIGDRVKTGMAVAIEPYVEIGEGCRIASGCVITSNLAAGSLVKAQVGHSVRKAG